MIFLYLIIISLILSIIDIRSKTVPVFLLIVFFIGNLVLILINGDFSLLSISLNTLIMLSFFCLILLFQKGKFGFGDVLYGSLFFGINLKLIFSWTAIFLSAVLCLIFLILRGLLKKKNLHSKTAFVPFLSAGLLSAYIMQAFL